MMTEQHDKNNSNNNFLSLFKKIILIFSIIIFCVSGALLLKYYVINPYIFNKKLDNIKKIKDKNQGRDFTELLNINQDIKGWIKINNTVIDYPVLQSSKDEPIFYLDRNFKKEKDQNGSIFINSYTGIFDSNTQNTVMHGHSMKSGKMFSALLKYSSLDYFKEHSIVEFDSIYQPGKWKIFAIIKTNSLEKHGKIFNYFTQKFDSQEDFLDLIYEIKIRSIINIPVEVLPDDKIISLSTCSYEMEGFRTVVFARKIRENESELIDFENTELNKNPLMPEGWYRARKIKMPKFEHRRKSI